MIVLKKEIRKIVYKYDILFKFYYRYLWKPPKKSIRNYLNILSKKKEIFFIQIGANDGMYDDPLYKFIRRDNWTGILIEPQKTVFNRLINNYKKIDGLYFENVAINNKGGNNTLYKIAFTDDNWASGISSFIKESLEINVKSGYVERKAKEDGIKLPTNKKDYIATEIVSCLTLSQLIEKYNVNKIDILMIDTEGYDFEIIKTINFKKIKPLNIIYEHTGLSKNEKIDCENYLKNNGYNIFIDIAETLASLDDLKF